MKNYLAKSLYHWLAATASPSDAGVLSCSDTTVQLAASAAASVKVGHILIQTDASPSSNNNINCDPCSSLFREITADLGDGRFLTEQATFGQVFPPETYDISYANQAVESLLPGCDIVLEDGISLDMARSLQGDNQTDAGQRKHDEDDDDDHYDDDQVDKKEGWEAFCDATKEFFYDMWCIIRNLDCAPYDAGINDDDWHPVDDDYPQDDDHKTGSSKDHRVLAAAPTRVRGLKGAKRSLQEEEEVNDLGAVVEEEDVSEAGATTTTINFETGGITTETSSSSSSAAQAESTVDAESHKETGSSKDHPDDDAWDDDDFFDDDDDHVDDEANFWKILDAIGGYIERIVCIFKDCPQLEHYEDDDYKSSDKDKHRMLEFFDPSTLIDETSAWLNQVIYGEIKTSLSTIPTTTDEWLALQENGNCPYTKCRGVEEPTQCFVTPEQSVAKSCRASLDNWFALPSTTGQDTTAMIQSWDLDAVCSGQDYCYASNVFEQTDCDEQFYKSLLQACPSTADSSSNMMMSRDAPLATSDLYEHCSLVSILLYSQAQQKSQIVYDMTRDNQNVFEAQNCH